MVPDPRLRASLLACVLFSAAPAAQDLAGTADHQWVAPRPVAGRAPGTQRWNVTFKERGFTLEEFRGAIASDAEAAVVDAIVRDLEVRARADQEPFRIAVEKLGGRVSQQFWLINACTIEIEPRHLAAVRALPNVLFVDADREAAPLHPFAAPALVIRTATNAAHHNADAEQALGNRATGLGVALVDTSQNDQANGVQHPHRIYYRNGDRANHTGSGMDGSRLIANYQVGAQMANYGHPHGTGVAGIAAGGPWGSANADSGHAADANIIGYSICDQAASCVSAFSTQAAAWQRVAADKVRHNIAVANMSYASSPSPLDVSQQAIDACALNADVLAVTGAGNDAASTQNSSSTANGIAVAACDNNKVMGTFSSRGPLAGDPQRFFPDITANGVYTVMPLYGNEFGDWVASGTSMASPQVCGAGALVKSARPASNARELKAILLCNTESIAAQNPAGRNAYGLGYLRDDLSCSAARASNTAVSGSITSGAPRTHVLVVTQNQPVSVVLVWHRQVMTSTSWSNLGLRVLNGASVVATSNDPRNLYEKVSFTAPITGNLTVEVSATSLEVASLPYSLAANATFGVPGTPATYTTFGQGCSGALGACNTVPAYAANAFANIGQISPLTFGVCRYQQVFLGSDLPAGFTMTGLSLRQDDQSGAGALGGMVDVEIQLGLTTRTPSNLTTTFAGNFDSGAPVPVLARSSIRLPDQPQSPPTDPRVFLVSVPFTTPFAWPASGGGRNLLIQITVHGAQNYYYPGDATSLGGTTQLIGYPDTAATGTVYLNVGAVMCFRSAAGGTVPLLTNTGTPRLGASFSVNLTQARASTSAFLMHGLSDQSWSGLPLPFHLGPAGAPGCWLWCSGEIIRAAATNAAGAASIGLAVPNDRSLIGGVFFNDWLVYDPTANALQFVTSGGGRGRFGDQ